MDVKTICDAMTTDERDILDCMHNLGLHQKMKKEYESLAQNLRNQYNEEQLSMLALYVSTKRITQEY